MIDLIGSIRFLVVYRWDNAGVQLATILARRYYADAQPVGAPFQVDYSDMPSTIALQVSEIRFGCETKKHLNSSIRHFIALILIFVN